MGWLLGKWRWTVWGVKGGKGFVVLLRRWLVERTFAWQLRCRRILLCYAGLCEVEAAWIWMANVRWLVRWMASKKC